MATADQAPATAGGPTQHTQNQGDARFSPYQLRMLHGGVHPNRVRNLRGMAHMEAWDIRRQLIRVFGFGGFSIETISLDLVAERSEEGRQKKTKDGRPYGDPYTAWTVVYRAQVRLTVFDVQGREISHWEDAAAGDSVNQPSLGDAHDMAMKTAVSQALKRCAVNLGDQFGLSLYNDGSREPVVNYSAAHPPAEWKQESAPPQPEPEDPPVKPEPQPVPVAEADRPVEAPRSVPQQRAQAAGPQPTPPVAGDLDRLLGQVQTNWAHRTVLEQVRAELDAKGLAVSEVQGPDGRWVKFGDLLDARLGEMAAGPGRSAA